MSAPLPQSFTLSLGDLNGSLLERLNKFARESIAYLADLRTTHEVITMEWRGGQTNVRMGVGPRRVLGVIPCQALRISDGAGTTVPGITWRQEGGEVVVQAMTGLTAGTFYRVSFFVIRG